MDKLRLDELVIRQGLMDSREKARKMIMAGRVLISGQVSDKPGRQFPADTVLEILEYPFRYVSRGAHKLFDSIQKFQPAISGRSVADIGASTEIYQVLLS